jgi:VWFA-related protein
MSQELRVAVLIAALLITPASPALAQDQDAPSDSGVTERVQVRLVQMALLARDRKGAPITDLSMDEIVVKDRGDRREVVFLNSFRTPQFQGPMPDVRLQVEAPGAWQGERPPAEREPAYLIIFVDAENDQRLQKSEAIDEANRFLENELDPEYRVAVFSYNGQINQESEFTTNVDALKAAVGQGFSRQPRPALDVHARVAALMDLYQDCIVKRGAFINTGNEFCIKTVTEDYAEERRPLAKDYMEALEGIVRYAAGLRGRKTILALSHGVPANPGLEAMEAAKAVFGNTDQIARVQLAVTVGADVRHDMDRLIDLAIRRKVTVHFVDRNLAPSADSSARYGEGMQPGAQPVLMAFEAPQFDIEEIATNTGGVFVGSPGELYAGLKKAIDIEEGGYYLGFYVDGFRSREQLSRIKVSTTRKGVKIGHRRGAFEPPPIGALGGQIKLGEPQPADGRPGQYIPFTIEANPYVMGYQVTKHVAEAHFTLHVVVTDESGRRVADSFHFISHGYPRDVWDNEEAEAITITGAVEAPAGRYTIDAYFHNSRNGREGEVTTEFVVDDAAPPVAQGDAE